MLEASLDFRVCCHQGDLSPEKASEVVPFTISLLTLITIVLLIGSTSIGYIIQTRNRRTAKKKSIHEDLRRKDEDNRRKDSLLNEILPKSVAERLLKGEPVVTETYDAVTVFFSDIVGEYLVSFLLVISVSPSSGFTDLASSSSPLEIVTMLNQLYTVLDHISSLFDVYKVLRYL